MAEVTREGPNAFKTLQDSLKAMDGVTGKVGWFEGSAYPDGTPVAYVAAINELGAPAKNIPSRSFMRSTALKKDKEWQETAAMISSRILEGKMTPKEGMEALCQKAEGDIAETISTLTAPALSPITLGARKYKDEGKKVTGKTIGEIARKLKDGTLDISGVRNKPLVDSSLMINTLTNTVEG